MYRCIYVYILLFINKLILYIYIYIILYLKNNYKIK